MLIDFLLFNDSHRLIYLLPVFSGTFSSHLIFMLHISLCINFLTISTGENKPSTSKILLISDRIFLLVITVLFRSLVILVLGPWTDTSFLILPHKISKTFFLHQNLALHNLLKTSFCHYHCCLFFKFVYSFSLLPYWLFSCHICF